MAVTTSKGACALGCERKGMWRDSASALLTIMLTCNHASLFT